VTQREGRERKGRKGKMKRKNEKGDVGQGKGQASISELLKLVA